MMRLARADDPDAGAKQNFTVHVMSANRVVERWFCNGLLCGARSAEKAGGRADLADEFARFGDGAERQLRIECVEPDVSETSSLENAAHTIRIGKSERARVVRVDARLSRDVRLHRVDRNGKPWIRCELAPANEREPAAGAHRAANIDERSRRIVEEHHAET